MRSTKFMIQFFEGVIAQHKSLLPVIKDKAIAETRIKSYEFVIVKLKEWENE